LILLFTHWYLLKWQCLYRCGTQGMGGFLMLEYQKSSAAHTLRTAGLGERDN